jgi:hypothetical protein
MGKPKGTFSVPRSFDSEQKRFAQLLNESVAVLKGELGDPLDAAVTYNDLINSGLAKRDLRIGSNGFIGGGGVGIIPGDGPVLDIPPAPTGVQVNGAFQNILIQWDKPTFVGFSYAEVWAATSDTFADRVLVGTSTASLFSHQVGNGQTRYYWVRFVNAQDVAGPFNSTTGIGDSTVIDIGAQMQLLSEELQNLPGYTALTTLITNADVANAAAAATANTAARVIRSTSAPTTRDDGSSLVQNDVWIDTDDNNQMYIRNASNNGWEEARDGTLVTLVNSINTQQGTNTTNIASATSDIITLTSENSSRASEITSLESTINNSSTGLAAAHSAISTEATTRATADTALASDITSLTSTVSSNTSAISSEATTRATADTALATDITNLTSTVGSNTSAISTEQTTRANADTALATDITNLTSTVSGNTSAIATEQTTRANADTALATDITNLTSTVSGNTSAISTEATTRANADTANATAISNLSSTVGTTNANVSTLQTSVSNLEGDADAMFVIQVATESNGSKSAAGMVIGSNASSGTGAQSYVQFQADKFAIWSGSTNIAPFIVDAGTVYIKEAMIENGSITNAKIQDATIDNAKITNTLDAAKITAGTLSADRLDASVILSTDLATNTSTVIHGGNISTNTLNADSIVTGSITGDKINVDTLNVKSFDNVSSTIVSHVTAGTKFPLARDGQTYIQRTGTYTGSNASFVPVTITQIRDNAGYVAIFSGVLGNVSGGRVQYSLNNSTWVNASGNTNIYWNAGTYRGYTYVYTGQITTLSASQSTVYWRVYFSGSYNHTQLSLNVMMDNTR